MPEVAEREVPVLDRENLDMPEALHRRRLGPRLIVLGAIVVVVVLVIVLVPGLASLRTRLAHAQPSWLAIGVVLKLLSGLSYVAVFRAIFCRRMSWWVSSQIGLSELAANALLPTGGAGGLALGAWALRRGGMSSAHIARRTVAFFLLTSVPNVVGLIIVGLLLAAGLVPGHASLALTVIPAVVAAGAIVGVEAVGHLAQGVRERATRAGQPQTRRVRALGTLADGVSESNMLLREHDPMLMIGLIGYLAFDVMVLWATFHAFGRAPAVSIIWIGYLIGELGGLIPVPGGLGGVDLGLVGTLALYKVPLAAATAAVLAYRAIALWVPAIVGSGAFLVLRRTLHGEAHEIAMCGPETTVEVIGHGRVRVEPTAGAPS